MYVFIQLSDTHTLLYIYIYIYYIVIDAIEDINVQQLASGVLNSNNTAHSSNNHTSNIRDSSDAVSSSFQQGGGGDSSDSDHGHNSDHVHNDTDTHSIDRQSTWPSHRPSGDFYTRYTAYRHTQQILHNTPSPTNANSSTSQQSPRPFPSLSPLTSPLKPTPTLTPTTTTRTPTPTTTSTAPLREWTEEEEYECMSKYMAQARILLVIAGGYDQNVSENVEYLDELQQHATSVELKHIYLESKTTNTNSNNTTASSSHNSDPDPTTATATATTSGQNYDPKDIEVVFRTSISDEERQLLLKKAAALLYTPDQEHFGIVPIEVYI